jgi:hypothetical protein
VQVAGGSYGVQTIEDDSSKDGPGVGDVVFRPAPGATAHFAQLTIVGRHILFAGTGTNDGFSFVTWTAATGADDVTFRDVSTQIFAILSASHISIIGGQVGPWDSGPAGEDSQIKAQSADTAAPTHILISGVYFHDITKKIYPDYHTDCLQFGSGQHVVIRNNTFERCSDTDLFIRSWARGQGDDLRDFVIEHNIFNVTTLQPGYFDLQLADSEVDGDFCDSFVFRYNVVLGRPIVFKCGPPRGTPGASELYGNVLPRVDIWTCGQNTATGNQPTYADNVYSETSSATCNPSESVAHPIVIVTTMLGTKGKSLRLRYTVVAPHGSQVKLTLHRSATTIKTLQVAAVATPGVRVVSLPASSWTGATRYCVTVDTPPVLRVRCAAIKMR